MNRTHVASCVVVVALACFSSAHAQQPPNPTASDGSNNTAGGTNALLNLVLPADGNTAFGSNALYSNTTGRANTALGENALKFSLTGQLNVALGLAAMANSSGDSNIAIGVQSQYFSTGNSNTSVGNESLLANGGDNNVAIGDSALYQSSTGADNVAVGYNALNGSTAGSNNIAIGSSAGINQTTGSNNIYIGNPGVAAEASTTRIGPLPGFQSVSSRAFITGIYGATITSGSTVLVNSNGQLGSIVSSERFKRDISDMGDRSSKLLDLRPVTFHYKTDPSQVQQYGLIAEEVAKVYPDLVVRSEKGDVDSVQYHELAPMLLNELQKQHKAIEEMRKDHARDVAQITELKSLLQAQGAILTKLQTRVEEPVRVASR